ncbi:hypothetical protein [Streptomyces mirabilis]
MKALEFLPGEHRMLARISKAELHAAIRRDRRGGTKMRELERR